MVTSERVRRPRVEARRQILEAAERLLVDGGPAAVQVRAVAEDVGMTDAGVYHHFGSRQGLLLALLRHGGRRLRDAVEATVDDWVLRAADISSLVGAIAGLYRQGYAELAVALHAAGWRDSGGGMLEPVVQALHAVRERSGNPADIQDTRLAVAALHQALALEPVYGKAFRRSAGIGAPEAKDASEQLAWWTGALTRALGLEP
jgi:AcrR family transcriptional regulator